MLARSAGRSQGSLRAKGCYVPQVRPETSKPTSLLLLGMWKVLHAIEELPFCFLRPSSARISVLGNTGLGLRPVEGWRVHRCEGSLLWLAVASAGACPGCASSRAGNTECGLSDNPGTLPADNRNST